MENWRVVSLQYRNKNQEIITHSSTVYDFTVNVNPIKHNQSSLIFLNSDY